MIVLRASEKSRRDAVAHMNRLSRFTLERDALERIAALVRSGIAANFDTQSSFDGAPWLPLRPRTVRDRRRLGFPPYRPILVRTGDYRRSMTMRSHPRHVESFSNRGPLISVEVGSSDIRVGTLEYGHGPFGVPPRRALGLSPMFETRLGVIIDQEVDRKMVKIAG